MATENSRKNGPISNNNNKQKVVYISLVSQFLALMLTQQLLHRKLIHPDLHTYKHNVCVCDCPQIMHMYVGLRHIYVCIGTYGGGFVELTNGIAKKSLANSRATFLLLDK